MIMSITSFWFLVLVAAGVFVYYITPKKMRWVELLILSLVFYYFAGTPLTILYLIADTLIAYISSLVMISSRKKSKNSSVPFISCIVSIILIVGIWLVVKGIGLWFPIASKFLAVSEETVGMRIISALGMGYFTLQILGYVIDCYWENLVPQKNPIKLFLFVAYFPQLTTGPISRYSQLEILFEEHTFNYDNICMGTQRILWGFCKKLVIAERLSFIVNGISADPVTYYGFYSWISLLLYPLQMYCDFSGCMDIVLGVSELFDIKLSENFNNPFFAKSSQEFWQRWHITLGTWAKDYVLFPLQKSTPMSKLGKYARKKLGKTKGNFIKNFVCMFFLWMVMGIWHGGYRYIVGVSLWYWVILMLGNITGGITHKLESTLGMKTKSFGFNAFRCVRTYLIYAIGAVFFSHGVDGGIGLLNDCLAVLTVKNYANPWIFFDKSILELGIEFRDINILIVGLFLLFIVGYLREKYSYARLWIKEQPFPFRWIVWIGLIVFVVLFGEYGPNFNASEFIYQGF